jgi:hypothetical protein
MSGFKLDTSGVVPEQLARQMHDMRWIDLSPFEQGYTAPILEAVGAPFHKLAPETLAQIIKDCGERWPQVPHLRGDDSKRDEGRAFWHFRNQGIIADFPPLTPTLADDGLIYLRAKP